MDAKQAWESDSNEALEDFFPSFAKYPNLEAMLNKIKDIERIKILDEEMAKPLRYWQNQIKTELEGPVNSRSIIWIVDSEGNKGKSWITK